MAKSTSPKLGRPSKLSTELISALVRELEKGHFAEAACDLVGLSRSTFYRWLSLGNQAERGQFRDFSDAIKKAQAKAEARDLDVINAAAASGHWQAAAWKLERRNPRRWGLQVRSAISREIEECIERLEAEFASEPQLYERALCALAAEEPGKYRHPEGTVSPVASPNFQPSGLA